MAALRAAVSAVRLGEHRVAVAVGSELVSRSLARGPAQDPDTPDTSFLRWTLSDGAGAVVVKSEPRPDGLSLRVDWMHLVSRAHEHPVCMSAGLGEEREPAAGATWLDRREPGPPRRRRFPGCARTCPRCRGSSTSAWQSSAPWSGPAGSTRAPSMSYSAGHFRAKLFDRLREAGYPPDEERWFTNLHSAGNTGAASIFVMLDAVRPACSPATGSC
jgi:3-oxoacyl-[acyl-carrier-protein] synthase-3